MKASLLPENRGGWRGIPPLEPGDHLSRAEFERRYDAMPGVKAELIEGIVHMPSPVRFDHHAEPHMHLNLWLGAYYLATPGLKIADNGSLRLHGDSVVQPDAMMFVPERLGGKVALADDGILVGPPEWIGEVASSTVSLDLHEKFDLYLRAGVREYLVWRVQDEAVDWFVRRDGRYHNLAGNERGILASTVFPGLRLDVPALLRQDMGTVMAALDEGLQHPEHAAFVGALAAGKVALGNALPGETTP